MKMRVLSMCLKRTNPKPGLGPSTSPGNGCFGLRMSRPLVTSSGGQCGRDVRGPACSTCAPPFRFRAFVAIAVTVGTLTCLPPLHAQEDPVHREWRQRIALTSRKFLQQDAQNPFVEPGDSVEPVESAGQQGRETTLDFLSGRLIRDATVGNGSPGVSPSPQTALKQGRELADWDWRERLRWFQTWGAGPASSTDTEAATGSTRIEPSTSSYWWFQNPFRGP